MRTYSIDLRERVIRAYDENLKTQQEIARLFKVSVPWIKKLLRQRRRTGSLAPLPHGGGWTPKFSGQALQDLKTRVGQNPDATLQELLEQSGIDASIMAVHRALERLRCRLKKSRSAPPSRIGRK